MAFAFEVRDNPPSLPCVFCSQLLEVPDSYPIDYFSDERPICGRCGRENNWWEMAFHALRDDERPAICYSPLLAHSSHVPFSVERDITRFLDLAASGIPDDALVLSVEYLVAPERGGEHLFPVELERLTRFAPMPITLRLFPRPVVPGHGAPPASTFTVASVVWVRSRPDDHAWFSLVEAFDAFCRGRLEAAIIPANVAVELTVGRLAFDSLAPNIARERKERFLNDAATYGHQLNVLLPTVLQFTDAPDLPPAIKGGLNKLRNLRNDVAHAGRLRSRFDRRDAAEVMCAALFGLHYFRFVEPFIAESRQTRRRRHREPARQ